MIMKYTDLELDDDDLMDDPVISDGQSDLEDQFDDRNQDLDTGDTQTNEPDSTDEPEEDIVSLFLRLKGIDASSIKFQNDKGETEEIAFNDLSKDEQLELLSYNPAQQDLDMQADEAQFLAMLRQHNMTVQDYLNAYASNAVKNYVDNQPSQQIYDVDSYTDDELFIADLKDAIPDLTEEEALEQLESEKKNPTLFQRKVDGLRANFKAREEQLRNQELADAQAAQKQQAAEFENLIVNTIRNNNSVDFGDVSLDMSTDDMNEIASFILDSDPAGVRYIAKALNDPKTLVNMAWFALKGQEAMRQTAEYYKRKISEVSKNKYEQGLRDGRSGKTTVITKTTSKKKNQTNYQSIDDLD